MNPGASTRPSRFTTSPPSPGTSTPGSATAEIRPPSTATSAGLEESLDAGRRCHNGGDAHLHLVIHEALERLSAPLRETIELRLQGYEIREIAELTGRPRRTVERLLQEARAELRGALEGTV